jgi:ankyrin repeat protein
MADLFIKAGIILAVVVFVAIMVHTFLKENRKRMNISLSDAVEQRDLTRVNELLEKKADVEYTAHDRQFLTPLMIASAQGNTEIVRTLIDGNASVNARNEAGVSALMYAILRGHQQTIAYLIEKQADVNHYDIKGNTPLSLAIMKQDVWAFKFLVEHGVDINSRNAEETGINFYQERSRHTYGLTESFAPYEPLNDTSGANLIHHMYESFVTWRVPSELFWRPPLWNAVDQGIPDLVKILLLKGADHAWKLKNFLPQGSLNTGINALMYASYRGNCDIISIFIKAGIDINVREETGKNSLCHAIEGNSAEAVKLLYKTGAHKMVDIEERQTALMQAVRSPDRLDMIPMLIDLGEKINERTGSGTALIAAASEPGNLEMVKWLLEHGAFVNERTEEGVTALMVVYDSPETLELLVKFGADINSRTVSGKTALFFAVETGDFNCAAWFIEHGADVNNAEFTEGKTPLMQAIYTENYESARLLLEHGADANFRDNNGKTSLDYAKEKKDLPSEIMDKLK